MRKLHAAFAPRSPSFASKPHVNAETAMEWEEIVKRARVLIVDDDLAHVRMLERMFEAVGYLGVTGVTDPREVPELYLEMRPDLILLDLHMPGMDGYEVMSNLAPLVGADEYMPVVVITGQDQPEHRLRALLLGAKDFVAKPVDRLELMMRVRIQLETRFLFLRLAERAERSGATAGRR
jgi:putative two-component system response regulator